MERKEDKRDETGGGRLTRVPDSKPSLTMSKMEPSQSKNLLLSSASLLLDLMEKMAEKKDDPRYVNAACKCAGEINKLLKFNLELMKLSKKTDRLD